MRPVRRVVHRLALLERCDGHYLEMLKNGLFGAVEVFNYIVSLYVQRFHSALTAAREALRAQPRWSFLFSGRVLFR